MSDITSGVDILGDQVKVDDNTRLTKQDAWYQALLNICTLNLEAKLQFQGRSTKRQWPEEVTANTELSQ